MDKSTESVWMADGITPAFDSLASDLECDVVVVGAGIAGVSIAYMLCKRGVNVILLDDGAIASGETERTTAHITMVLDRRYSELERWHGEEKTRLIVASQRAAVEKIAEIVVRENIECDFHRRDGFLFQLAGDDSSILEDEFSTMQRLGLDDVSMLKTVPIDIQYPGPCLKIPHQAQFHILDYLSGLMDAIVDEGGKVFCDTHVTSLKEGKPVTVHTDSGHSIQANHVVIATNSPVCNLVAIHTKQMAYRSYVIGMEMPSGLFFDGLYWDTQEPYHYLRTQTILNKRYLMVGGEDRKTGQDEDYLRHFRSLEDWSRRLIPELGPVEFTWSGQVYEPVDGIAFIGHDPGHKDNVYVATGFAGVGMTQGTLAGMILADMITGKENPFVDLYNPSRKTVATVDTYVKENVNAACQYADHFKGSDFGVEDIPEGEGAVISEGTHKLAVYRDDWGQLHKMSAVCPHMKALVRWNPVEKSWDCPAHGSRFDAMGGVIDGPANCDLTSCPLELDDAEAMKFAGLGGDDPLVV